jgi:two-component system, sensor histidine kinase RegB
MSTEAGASPGEAPEAVALGELVHEAARAVSQSSRIDVRVEEDDARMVRVPRRATTQALRGLLDNACDASAADASVELVATARDGRCCVEVRDRGAGMSAEVLARAGEPFFTTKEPGKGMGLGLFLTHALADRLGGRLEIESQPGRGTIARLYLPLADATIDRIAPAPALAEG